MDVSASSRASQLIRGVRPMQLTMETPEQRIQRVVREEVAIVAYDAAWPEFVPSGKAASAFLLAGRPDPAHRALRQYCGAWACGEAHRRYAGGSDRLGGDQGTDRTDARVARVRLLLAPYAWRRWSAILRLVHQAGLADRRPHAPHSYGGGRFTEHWDRLLFRDYLIEHPEVAREYEALKIRLAAASPRDRVAYTRGKTKFIDRVTEQAKRYYGRA